MKVIILKDTPKVGQKYEVKNVADGYALNFLIPRGLAKTASNAEIKNIEKLKEQEDQKRQKQISDLRDKLENIRKDPIELKYKANEKGHLFKGLHKEELIQALEEQKGLSISPDYIVLDKPIKELGDYEIEIKAFNFDYKIKVSIKAA